jgi:CysZ protein
MKSILDGMASYGKAITLVNRLGLWGYVLAPGLVSILVAVGLFGTAWGLSDNIGDALLRLIPGLADKGWAENAARIASAVVILALGLVVFKQLVLALAAPIMSPLSEKVERYLAGDAYFVMRFSVSQMMADMIRGLRIALRNVARELLFTMLLLLLGLIPVIGVAAPVLIFIVQAYYAGFGNMDYTLERHFKVRDSVRFVRRHRGVAIGNGVVFLLLLLTGIGFLFALPLGAVAATVETRKRL